MMRALFASFAALALAACATTAVEEHAAAGHAGPEATPFVVTGDAMARVEAALEAATARDTRLLLVTGANWCHDSRALAGRLGEGRLKALANERYELVFVNVGMPQEGDGHNLAIARRFGLDDLPGTPNVLVLSPDGKLLNADSATGWRNAASRNEAEIYAELERLAGDNA